MSDARRVVLLARPGPACDRMRAALAEAGALVVLEADPVSLAQDALVAAGAHVVLVVLDAATEDVIDRFDAVLADPSIEVIFEEAELAASREGWDAARWVRHLSAKLNRHGNVLPPGREADGEEPVRAEPVASAATPAAPALDPAPAPEPARAEPTPAPESVPVAVRPVLALVDDDHFTGAAAAREPAAAAAIVPLSEQAPGPVAGPPPLPWELDAGDATADAGPNTAPAASTAAELATSAGPAALSLVDEAPPAAQGAAENGEADPEADQRFQRDLADLEARIAEMGLVEPPASAAKVSTGAVVVLAGIGGPDAVRQLLGALPSHFARPVLVQQRLDGGRYDKLVAQMQRATTLPVRLAEVGDAIEGGTIYIVPPSMGVAGGASALAFSDAGGDLMAGVPAGESAVLMLSGSDPALVDAAMNLSWSGALVAAQALDGCYDAAAPTELIARGALSGSPTELARRLAERWPS
ncbi:MAG: hypothetical protein NDI66_00380 [Pseudomonas sp.]|nr:hypothetical protein [Pseudomonas sp.]